MNASRKHSWSRLLPESLSNSENCVLHRLSRNVGKIVRTGCVIHCLPHITHKNAVLIYFAADAWKRVIRLFQYYITPKEVLQIMQWHSPSSVCHFHPTHLYQCYTFCSAINLFITWKVFARRRIEIHYTTLSIQFIVQTQSPWWYSSLPCIPDHYLPRGAALFALK